MTIFNNNSQYTPPKPSSISQYGPAFFADNVLVDNPDPYSLASLIMLKRSLHNRRNTGWMHKACRVQKRRFMKEMFAKGPVVCFNCKIELVKPTPQRQTGRNVASVDHIIPIEKNYAFARDPRNFRMACQRCNCGRAGK